MNPARLIPIGTVVDIAVLGTHTWSRLVLQEPLRFRFARRNGDHLLIEHDGSVVCVEAGKVRAIPRLPCNRPNFTRGR